MVRSPVREAVEKAVSFVTGSKVKGSKPSKKGKNITPLTAFFNRVRELGNIKIKGNKESLMPFLKKELEKALKNAREARKKEKLVETYSGNVIADETLIREPDMQQPAIEKPTMKKPKISEEKKIKYLERFNQLLETSEKFADAIKNISQKIMHVVRPHKRRTIGGRIKEISEHMRTYMRWSAEEIQKAVELKEAGMSYKDIAFELGRTESSVKLKIWRALHGDRKL